MPITQPIRWARPKITGSKLPTTLRRLAPPTETATPQTWLHDPRGRVVPAAPVPAGQAFRPRTMLGRGGGNITVSRDYRPKVRATQLPPAVPSSTWCNRLI